MTYLPTWVGWMSVVLIEVEDVITGKQRFRPRQIVLKNVKDLRAGLEVTIATKADAPAEAMSKVSDARGRSALGLALESSMTLTAGAGAMIADARGAASVKVNIKFTRNSKHE